MEAIDEIDEMKLANSILYPIISLQMRNMTMLQPLLTAYLLRGFASKMDDNVANGTGYPEYRLIIHELQGQKRTTVSVVCASYFVWKGC
jgi:hypothetical protein